MRLSLQAVAEATRGVAEGAGNVGFTSYHTDSREVRPGGLFFALVGAEMDGHRFVVDALERGAAGVVVRRDSAVPATAVAVRVDDTWQALAGLARTVKERVSPLTVGVTGSNGKTSTKEFLAAALELRGPVLKTEGNLNTETGMPLTMLALEPRHRSLVLEMGLQQPGDISHLAALARPSIGVITGIGTVHLEYFRSQADLAREKGALVASLPAVGGVAVLPAASAFIDVLRELTQAQVVTFGPGGNYEPVVYEPTATGGRFEVRGVKVRLSLAGRHMADNACAALAAATAAGVDLEAAAERLAEVRVGQRLEERAAPEGFTVVDDSYNASPESMLAAFAAVDERPRHGRLLAVLGEMRELGPAAEAAHREVGAAAARAFDAVAVVDAGHGAHLAAAAGGELVADREAAAAWVRATARPGDVVLIKASHGVHLELLVADLINSESAS